MIVKNIDDTRAMTDIGAAIFAKRAGESKYSLWLAVTNIPATGTAPETVETTVTTSRKKTYTFGRQDNPQKECTFMAHRDNFEILRGDYNKKLDFLQINPDGTGWKFQGFVSFYQDEVSVGGNITGKAVITVTSSDELPVKNVLDIIQETVTFVSAIPADVELKGAAGTKSEFNIITDPADATIEVESDTEGVATVAHSDGKVTITSVAKGSALIKITASKADCTSGVTYVLAKVDIEA
jgi:hypothetical protein